MAFFNIVRFLVPLRICFAMATGNAGNEHVTGQSNDSSRNSSATVFINLYETENRMRPYIDHPAVS